MAAALELVRSRRLEAVLDEASLRFEGLHPRGDFEVARGAIVATYFDPHLEARPLVVVAEGGREHVLVGLARPAARDLRAALVEPASALTPPSES